MHDNPETGTRIPAVPLNATGHDGAGPRTVSRRAFELAARWVLLFAFAVLCLCLDITDPEFAESLRRELK